MSNPGSPVPLDTATIRRLAVEASVDPQSIRKRLKGLPVRGLASHRIDEVLSRHGLSQTLALSSVPNHVA